MASPQVSFCNTSFAPGTFYSKKREIASTQTVQAQLQALKDTGRYDAFKLKWHPSYNDKPNHWPVPNHLFWDSDCAKWMEGACYFLKGQKDPEIDAAVQELVEMIRSAQQPDGYLNIHFTVVAPEQRFSNLRDLHELYNAGHLIEAALAHRLVYQNDRLLEPIVKYVNFLGEVLGPDDGQKHGYPGHPEIELALIRLYGVTKDPNHLKLARYFITERGNPKGAEGRHYYDVEAEARGDRENEMPAYYPQRQSYWYNQAHVPIVEQKTIEGHSVRAMYLLTAVADLVLQDKDLETQPYKDALFRLWSNMVEQKMYLTGGIGAIKQWEGFGINYFLPQSTDEGGCYSETCASIGAMMLAERLLQIDLDGKYADIMELSFFNVVMGGMSDSGKQFTYENQLASSDSDPCKRYDWFQCACCPPNVTRLLGYLGGYFWTSHEQAESLQIDVHMYGSATLSASTGGKTVSLKQESNWPWEGKVQFSLDAPSGTSVNLKLRIPGWTSGWEITPSLPKATVEKGYLTVPADWLKQNTTFQLNIPLNPRIITPHPYTNQHIVAVARGPLVYCVEDTDNDWVQDHFKSLLFDPKSPISEHQATDPKTGEKYIALTANARPRFLEEVKPPHPGLELGDEEPKSVMRDDVKDLKFVPYFFRANRGGRGQMRVGLRRLQ